MWGYKPENSDHGRSALDFQIVKSIPKRPRPDSAGMRGTGGPAMPSGCDL
jgi:hypothetical protein